MEAERTAEVIVRVSGFGKEDIVRKLGVEVARACHGYGLDTQVSVLTDQGEEPINFDPIVFDGNEPPGYVPPGEVMLEVGSDAFNAVAVEAYREGEARRNGSG